MSQAGDVRQILFDTGGADFEQLCQQLDLVGAKDRKMLRLTLKDLEKSQEVALAGEVYRLLQRGPQRGDLQERLWEACTLENPGFTVGQVVKLAGGSPEYVQRCLRFWADGGFLERTGRAPSRKFGRAYAYRIKPGQDKETPPRWNRRAEEAKRKGSGVRGQGAGKDPVAQALSRIGNFVSEARQILGEANVRVTSILTGMEVVLTSVVPGVKESEVADGPESGD